jgi:hypothetical protein
LRFEAGVHGSLEMPPTELYLRPPHASDHLTYVLVDMGEDRNNTIFITQDFRPSLQCYLLFPDVERIRGRKQTVGKRESCIVIFTEDRVKLEML